MEICDPWPTVCDYPHSLQPFMISFMSLNSKKCIRVPTEIVEQKEILVEPNLSYVEFLSMFLIRKEWVIRRKAIKMYKIQ
jgi:hypothetical protein